VSDVRYYYNGKELSQEEFKRLPSRGDISLKRLGLRTGWPAGGRYVSGAARFENDPQAYCVTRQEAIEKIKRQGKEILLAD